MKRNVLLSAGLLGLWLAQQHGPADWTGKARAWRFVRDAATARTSRRMRALEVKNTAEKWAHTMGFAGNYGSDSSTTTAQRWEVRGQSELQVHRARLLVRRGPLRGRPLQRL